jgi:hypothetical protein
MTLVSCGVEIDLVLVGHVRREIEHDPLDPTAEGERLALRVREIDHATVCAVAWIATFPITLAV